MATTKERFTHDLEVTVLRFTFSSLKRFEMFMYVADYNKYGVKAPVYLKLGKTERIALGTTLPVKIENADVMVYRVNKLYSEN